MNNQPMIHVIIPVYNCEKYVSEAIESVLKQPYSNIHIILVNDGSTDSSPEICSRYATMYDRVKVIHQKNSGVSAARNAGIEFALSDCDILRDYIVFCDADDVWAPDAINASFFEDRKECDMYIFNMLGSNQSMDRFSVFTTYKDEEIYDPTSIIWEWNSFFVSHLYSCKLISKYSIRFSTKTKYVEDRMFDSICLYLSRSVCRVDRYLYIYRYNSSSAMHTKGKLPPTVYFSQIIDGWIETDDKINSYSAETNRQSRMGYTLASIYFMDMAAEHYQRWGRHQEIEFVLQSHPYYYLCENMCERDVSAIQYKKHLLMKNHSFIFRISNYVAGIKASLVEFIYLVPIIKRKYLERKFPLAVMPMNTK